MLVIGICGATASTDCSRTEPCAIASGLQLVHNALHNFLNVLNNHKQPHSDTNLDIKLRWGLTVY